MSRNQTEKPQKYKQLPLTGDENDFYVSELLLTGYKDTIKTLTKFFDDNKEYNPRQLEYMLCYEISDISLDERIVW